MAAVTNNTNRNNNRNRSSRKRDTIPSWLNAIDQVNKDMFGSSTVTASASASSLSPSPSLAYLKFLEEKLRRIPSQYWNHPPRRYPPSFASFCNRYAHAASNNLIYSNNNNSYHNNMAMGGSGTTVTPVAPMLLVPSAVVSSKTPQATILSQNPFAALQDFSNQEDDDDDDIDTDDDTDDNVYKEDHEYQTQVDDPSNPNAHMNIRRLLLRILLSQSEIQGRLARDAVSPTNSSSSRPLWNMGAQYISQAVYGLHQAVQIVDEQLSLWLSSSSASSSSQQQQQPQPLPQVKLLQEQDAHVLQVALDHYTRQEMNFGKKAEMQKIRLEQRLLPQWQSRDEIRGRLGERKWKNNPNPKMDYAVKRQQDEEELHELERALELMEEVKGRSRIVRDSVRGMAQEENWTERRSRRFGDGNGNGEDGNGGGGKGMHRYNGVRPTGATLHQRVSWEDYPDPTAFGWIFTGSNEVSRVEFFESMQKNGPKESVEEVLVKLDWYYTTATVKTSLDHPRQGKRQLFGAQVSPDVYVQILENPRAHTNVRYHTTTGGESDGGVGSGTGGGRGRGRGRGGRGRGRGRGNGGRGRGRGGVR